MSGVAGVDALHYAVVEDGPGTGPVRQENLVSKVAKDLTLITAKVQANFFYSQIFV